MPQKKPNQNSKVTSSKQILPYNEIQKIADELREDVIKMLLEAKSGHLAGALGMAEIFASLYFCILKTDPQNPEWDERDRLILSNGHVCPVWYATLARKGFFDKKELWKLRQINSMMQGHPNRLTTPGVEVSTGTLGQGFSQAAGMALAAKMTSKSHRIYCITSDGELQEGQTWETAMFVPNKGLTNLTWIIDRNNIQIDGYTESLMPLENLRDKLEAFNWFVIEIDGHNIEEIINACNMAKTVSQRPTVIIAHTIPSKGVKFMEYKFEWHGNVPNKVEAEKALKQLRSMEGKISYE